MFTFGYLRRRVSVTHSHGALLVHVAPRNDRGLYIVLLAGSTAALPLIGWILLPGLFLHLLSRNWISVSPFLAFFLLWYVVVLWVAGWRGFGIEDIRIDGGMMCWTRTALFWKRRLEIPLKDITRAEAVTAWHTLGNRVELTVLGRRRKIGDMLLRDEAAELALALKRAVGVRG